MEGGIVSLAMVSHVPWMLKFLNAVSGGKEAIERARRLGRRKVSERLKLGARRKDLFYYLTDEEGTGRIRPSDAALTSDGLLAIIAGSDTTSTTFMALFWNLVKNPQAYARLQREIDANFARGELPCDVNKMVEMGYLNACISETLRLFPALPSGSPRYVPLGGGPKVLGKQYALFNRISAARFDICTISVVPGMQVLLHTWAIHRDPRYFSPSPDSFIPERWLTPDELSRADIDVFKVLPPETTVHDINAYFPFSIGPANCVGKNLALMEMRMVVCQLLHLFRFSRFEGDPVDEWEHDLQEFLIYKKPDVFVRIERR
ncbi:hypothetical protein EWM64_g4698 [Hericium alpestre]|uniref:Cytochrome P450 n=1 Tax=Hericium alpestre TaxID=135208 RepID=A0A4Y9ZZ33_9AGAM|nr:hypothetical protein EWM64_g4698 [Hericium alpestre]